MRVEFARLILLQIALVLAGATVVYMVANLPAVKSFVYGNMVAIIVAILLAWRYKQGLRIRGAAMVLRHGYKTTLERFVWAIFLLILGFKFLNLLPFWLLAGFVVGQAAWLLAPIWMRLSTQNDK